MSDEFLYPEDVSSASIKKLFDDAEMETAIDHDGDVLIKDKYSCFLRSDTSGKMILIYAIFGFDAGAQVAAKLEFVNRVNDQGKLIRASVMSDGRLFFDYYIPIDGGIAKRAVVISAARFLFCIAAAMAQDTDGVVA